jgi:sugar O-acyltransferase (sialic acid O-acetyltransferase NeuD family)
LSAPELIIVGAGGHGREVAHAWLLGRGGGATVGFLDDGRAGETPEGWPILGTVAQWPRWRDRPCIVGINDPRVRRAVVAAMNALGEPRWTSVVHPGVALHESVRLGKGAMILGGVQATVHVSIGDFASVNRLVSIGHDVVLGDFASVAPLASLSGHVTVRGGADIGTSAAIRQGVELGAGCGVGMGSVVLESIAPNALVVGNPARHLRELDPW